MTIQTDPGMLWRPLCTTPVYRPTPGYLLAHQHAVWRVMHVEDIPLDDTDREIWHQHGMPDLATWEKHPYKVSLEWVGGAEPPWQPERKNNGVYVVAIRASNFKFRGWCVYRDGRWPQCSCCGEPMPCRTELQERQIKASLDEVARLEAIPPGACWACSEPITTRQDFVTYPGDNLDLPSGQQVSFHTRRRCLQAARDYEERWLAADPRRERILTWPTCDGLLIVHADGVTECVSGHSPFGMQYTSQPDCHGHETHDHKAKIACYAYDHPLNPRRGEAVCPRGCRRENHPGCTLPPRPKRRRPPTRGAT